MWTLQKAEKEGKVQKEQSKEDRRKVPQGQSRIGQRMCSSCCRTWTAVVDCGGRVRRFGAEKQLALEYIS